MIMKQRLSSQIKSDLNCRRQSSLPLRTIIHGELWEKNILLHRRSHFEMPPPEDGGHSPGKNRKVFDPKTSLGQHNGSSLDPDELRTEEDKEFLASRFENLQGYSCAKKIEKQGFL